MNISGFKTMGTARFGSHLDKDVLQAKPRLEKAFENLGGPKVSIVHMPPTARRPKGLLSLRPVEQTQAALDQLNATLDKVAPKATEDQKRFFQGVEVIVEFRYIPEWKK